MSTKKLASMEAAVGFSNAVNSPFRLLAIKESSQVSPLAILASRSDLQMTDNSRGVGAVRYAFFG